MPGFAVLFEAGTFASLGVEAEAFAGGEGFDGEDVPDVERDYMGEDPTMVGIVRLHNIRSNRQQRDARLGRSN